MERKTKGECRIFSVINQKGGVAKSVSTYTLGYELAKRGLQVLCIDGDPQANLSAIANIDSTALDCTIADVLLSYAGKKRKGIEECILQLADNFYIAPSIIDLSAVDSVLNGVIAREYVLQKALAPVKEQFDVIFIDCMPSLSLLPLNALACSTDVIIPCCTEYLAYRGLELLSETIEMVKENLNEKLNIYGCIASKHEANVLHNKEILELLEKNYNVLGVIPKSVKVSDAMYSETGTVIEFAPDSKPAIAYKEIADTIYNDLMGIDAE